MKTISVLLAFLILLLLLCYQAFSLVLVRSERDHFKSERLFYRNAATQVCLGRDAVVYAAETQSFTYFGEGLGDQLIVPFPPNDTTSAVSVIIEPTPFTIGPPYVFTKFLFDQDGCWISAE